MRSPRISGAVFNKWNNVLKHSLEVLPMNSILTVSLVGSHQIASHFDAIHDVDIVVVLEVLGAAEYLTLVSCLGAIAYKLTSETIKTTVEMRGGPIKPIIPPDGLVYVQLHASVYDRQGWAKVRQYPGCLEWIENNILIYGSELSTLDSAVKLTIPAIQRDLEVLERNVRMYSAYSRVYSVTARGLECQMEDVPLKPDQYAQMMVSSAFSAIRNTKKAMAILGRPQEDDLSSHSQLLARLGLLGPRIKQGDHSAVEEVLQLEGEISAFLAGIIEHLAYELKNASLIG